MNEETEKKLLNLLERIESHLAKIATQKANSAAVEIPIGEHIEADVKIVTPGREWRNGGGWFYDAEIEFGGGKMRASFAVNKKVHDEMFDADEVIFARLEKGKPNKRGETTFWLSSLISRKGSAVKGDPFEDRQPKENPVWQIGSAEPPPF